MTTLGSSAVRRWQYAWIAFGALFAVLAGSLVAFTGPMLLVALVCGLGLVAAIVRAPGILLAAYLLIPYYKGALQPYSPVDLTILLGVANAAGAVVLLRQPWPRTSTIRGAALWATLGILVLAGVLYAPDQSVAFGKAVTYWALVVLPIVPAALRVGREPRQVAGLLWTFFAMGVATTAVGIAQLSSIDRLTVLGMNTIQVARAALLVPIVGVAFVLPQRRPAASLITLVAIPLAIVVAIASGSRGPLLALAVLAAAGAFRYLLTARVGRGRVVTVGMALVTVGTIVLLVLGPELPALSLARFVSLLDFLQGASGVPGAAGGETSAAERVVLFQFAIQLWTLHPVIGAGTAGFQILSGPALGAAADVYPHNAVLQIMAEYGIVGLALFASVIGIGLFRRLPPGTLSLTVRALFAFFLINAMVSGDIFTDRETLGLLMLIIAFDLPATASAIATDAGAGAPIGTAPPAVKAGPAPGAVRSYRGYDRPTAASASPGGEPHRQVSVGPPA